MAARVVVGMPRNLSPKAVDALNTGLLAHLVTINEDGSPYVRCVWTHAEAGELTIGTMSLDKRYVRNLQRDPRVTLSYASGERDDHNLEAYLVVEGRAEVIPGVGGRELLNRLAKFYIEPDYEFLPESAGEGNLVRIAIDKVSGAGEWAK